MNESLKNVIKDLESQLETASLDSDWYQRKFKEAEIKIISLKETIEELKAMKTVMA